MPLPECQCQSVPSLLSQSVFPPHFWPSLSPFLSHSAEKPRLGKACVCVCTCACAQVSMLDVDGI